MLTGKTIGQLTNLASPTSDTLFPVELSGITYHIQFSAITGNTNIVSPLTFAEGSSIESIPNSAGDGSGLTTLTLKPDVSTSDDRYIVLDPTGPNHIHIRAGGTIDDSAADLILGGEKTHVSVSDDYSEVGIKSQHTIDVNTFTFLPGNGFSTSEWFDDGGVFIIQINDPVQLLFDTAYGYSAPSVLSINYNGTFIPVTILGTGEPTPGQPIFITVADAPPSNPTTLDELRFDIRVYRNSSIYVFEDIEIEAAEYLRLYSNNRMHLRNYSETGSIDVSTNFLGGNQKTWTFNTDGSFEFPDGTKQTTAYSGLTDSISSGPSAPGSAVVANPTNVNINFSDGIGTAWSFSPTGMTFPDDTIQTTAYSGSPKYYAESSTPPNVSPIATGDRSIAIGDGAESNSNDVISFGTRSGSGATNSSNSIFLGENSGSNSTGSEYSVFISPDAGADTFECYGSVFIGNSAGFSGYQNYESVFIGTESGYQSKSSYRSVFIGELSGQEADECGGSIFLGNSSGRGQSGATFSIFLGQNSGNAQGGKYLGNNNIIIGNYVMLPTGSTNSLNIGNVIYGKNIYDFSSGLTTFSAQTEGKIGIGVVDPTARLHLGKSTTLSALMRLEVGPAPTSPNDGDIWLESNTSTGLKIRVSGVTRTIQTTDVPTLYLLEAYANETYTLPGSFTDDTCRYSIVNNTVNVPSGWFNTSTYRFTPQKAGYWEITATYDVYRNSEASMAIRKNGAVVAAAGSFNAVAQQVTKIVYLNGSTDYVDAMNTGGGSLSRAQFDSRSWFQARWVGE